MNTVLKTALLYCSLFVEEPSWTNLSLRVINTIVFIPKVLSSRGGVFLFFLRLYRRRVAWKCLIAKFSFPAR